jgi:HSP20 family molecular chaperone IbpA
VAIPTDVFLNVKWPPEATRRSRKLLVTGTTEPGSRVSVDGVLVKTDDDGGFSREVELAEGQNTVKVQARGVGGVLKADQKDIAVKTKGPVTVVKTKDLWGDGEAAPPAPAP